MSDIERIDQRLSAVERAVVDSDVKLDQLADLATLTEDLDRLEDRIEAHEQRIASLEGTVDALDGFAGSVESVNEDVEKQADAAIAAVDRLEYRIDELEDSIETDAVFDFDEGDDVADGSGTDRPALESADVGHDSASGDQLPGVADRPTEADIHDGPFSGGEGPERTAGALLDGPAEESDPAAEDDSDDSSSGFAVQRAIERRLSSEDAADADSADDGSVESSTADDGSAASSTADDKPPAEATADEQTDADDQESSGLLATLRARLS